MKVRQPIVMCLVLAGFALFVACGSAHYSDPESALNPAAVSLIPTAIEIPDESISSTTTTLAIASNVTPETIPGITDDDRLPLVDAGTEFAAETWDWLLALTLDHSPRTSASDQEKVAAEFLSNVFEEAGYETEIQPFTVSFLSREHDLFTIYNPEPESVPALPLIKAGFGEATGVLIDVGLALEEDIPDEGLNGKIAFIRRGKITFEEKMHRVEDAGAAAAVIQNNEPGNFTGTLSTPTNIPAVSISKARGDLIAKKIIEDDMDATVVLVADVFDSRNVIARSSHGIVDAPILILGAHYDTVPDSQGANDNGSGLAVLISVARHMVNKPIPFQVRFIAFGAEEIGLFGSGHYVATLEEYEKDNVLAMINFDSLASGSGIHVVGDSNLAGRVIRYGQLNNIDVSIGSIPDGAQSDHVPFSDVGIPALMFISNDLSRINTQMDTIEFINRGLMGEAVALTLGLVDDFVNDTRR